MTEKNYPLYHVTFTLFERSIGTEDKISSRDIFDFVSQYGNSGFSVGRGNDSCLPVRGNEPDGQIVSGHGQFYCGPDGVLRFWDTSKSGNVIRINGKSVTTKPRSIDGLEGQCNEVIDLFDPSTEHEKVVNLEFGSPVTRIYMPGAESDSSATELKHYRLEVRVER